MEVLREASKVLLIAGGPSYEYRFLKNLLRRDARIHLAAWLLSADPDFPQEGNVSLKKLPSTPRELREYDVILLIDLDPAGLPADFPTWSRSSWARSAAVSSTRRAGSTRVRFFESPDAAPLRNVLPVGIAHADLRDEIGSGAVHEKSGRSSRPPPRSTTRRRASPRIDRNRERWAEVAGVYWSFPARKEKPGARVLFVHPPTRRSRRTATPRPLAAAQAYEGGGRLGGHGLHVALARDRGGGLRPRSGSRPSAT